MKLHNLMRGTQFKRSFLVAAVAASCATSAFALPVFTFNPSSLCAAGATCSNITADNIIISDFATVAMIPGTNRFTESGYLQVAGFQLNGAPVTPTGFNTAYNLYIPFSGTGRLTSANMNPVAGPTNGVFDTLNYQFIGKTGAGTGSAAFDSGTVLGTGSLIGGFVNTSQSTSTPFFAPAANIDFSLNPSAGGFFASPIPFYNLGFSSFVNTSTEIRVTSNGFIIDAGGGTVNFAARVPEPATVALLGLGLLGVAASRRKSAKNKNA